MYDAACHSVTVGGDSVRLISYPVKRGMGYIAHPLSMPALRVPPSVRLGPDPIALDSRKTGRLNRSPSCTSMRTSSRVVFDSVLHALDTGSDQGWEEPSASRANARSKTVSHGRAARVGTPSRSASTRSHSLLRQLICARPDCSPPSRSS